MITERSIAQLPGTPEHQQLLAAITHYYVDDHRVRALLLFGSLARGNWTPLSDLDLDVVVEDGVVIEPVRELEALCQALAALGGEGAIIVPNGAEAGDVVLANLMEFSIRYHPLVTTSPNIIDDMRLLAGRLDAATIRAAGLANRKEGQQSAVVLVNQCIRWAAGVDIAIQRNRLWMAVELLHHIRGAIMQLFALPRGAKRPIHCFEAEADAEVQTMLGNTLPTLDRQAMYEALIAALTVLEFLTDMLSEPTFQLAPEQTSILNKIRMRAEAANRVV